MFVVNKKVSRASNSFNFVCDYVLIGDDKGPLLDGAILNQRERTALCGVIHTAPFISLIVKKPTPYAISLIPE